MVSGLLGELREPPLGRCRCGRSAHEVLVGPLSCPYFAMVSLWVASLVRGVCRFVASRGFGRIATAVAIVASYVALHWAITAVGVLHEHTVTVFVRLRRSRLTWSVP